MVFTYKDLRFRVHPSQNHGIQAVYSFENGYSVSVVKFAGSLGWLDGLYEMAVLKDGVLVPDEDAYGYLTRKDVGEMMTQVSLRDSITGELPEGVERYEQEGQESKEAFEEKMVGLRAFAEYLNDDDDNYAMSTAVKLMLNFN